MRNRTLAVASVAMALGGIGIPASLLSVSRAQQQPIQVPQQLPATRVPDAGQSGAGPSGQPDDPTRRRTGMPASNPEAQKGLSGVQTLFAHATDAAVMRNGFAALTKLFASEDSVKNGTAPAATPDIGAATGGARGATPAPTTGASSPASARSGSEEPAPAALNQIVDQFNREWKQKYSRDFRINDPTLVFADITANDIMSGPPQLASGQVSGVGAATHVPNATGATTNPTGPAAVANVGEEVIVNVPPVQGSQAITVRVVRAGGNDYRFAVAGGTVDPQRLAAALHAHLKTLMDQKARWPTDAAQGQRLVTQHILMAIAEVSGGGAENAQPAGLHLPGAKASK